MFSARSLIVHACVALCIPSLTFAQQEFRRAQPLDATAAVRVFSMAGSISVVGWDRDSIDVSGTVGAGLTPRGGGTRSAFKLSTYDGMQDGASPSHLTLRVPRRAQLYVKASSSRITVRDVAGSVELYSIDGAIDIAGSPAELTVESMRGPVTIRGTPAWLRARSGSAAARFDGHADDLSLSTVSGDIDCRCEFVRGRVESARGAIAIASTLQGAASLEIDNHTGTVQLTMSPPAGIAFMAYTVKGAINNLVTADGPRASRGTGRELSLTTGTGKTRVVVRTFSGNVTLQSAALPHAR